MLRVGCRRRALSVSQRNSLGVGSFIKTNRPVHPGILVKDFHHHHRQGYISGGGSWQGAAASSYHTSSSTSSDRSPPPLPRIISSAIRGVDHQLLGPSALLLGQGGTPLAILRQTAGLSSQPAPQQEQAPPGDKDLPPLSGGRGRSPSTPSPAPAAATADGKASSSSSSSSSASQQQQQPPPRYIEEGFKPEDLKPEQGVEDPRKEENSPRTVGGIVRRYANKTAAIILAAPGAIVNFTVWFTKALVNSLIETIKNPSSLKERWDYLKKITKEEFHHYALGTKVLWSDMKTSWSIIRRLLNGHTLSRRERRQLTRTTADLFRLVPFAFFVIVPFMELLLPVALKIFPNMLPSTFQDSLKTEENMKRELKVRLALAGFLKDTLGEITNKKVSGKDPNAQLLNEFVEKARAGTHISTQDINRFARLFKDELTLDNMSRPQLAGMCVYMGLRPYGSDNFLRFQLRAKLRSLKEDDGRIVWEGIDNMNKAELREACRERGMRAYGLTQLGYRRQLQQWLDLSINKEVPISLLILSRAFTLDSKFADPAAAVADSISSLDKDVVNEVILDVASGAELRSPDIRAKKLESIERQNELIEEELKRERERKKKAEDTKKAEEGKKKAAEEEKKKAAAAAEATSADKAKAGGTSEAKGADTAKQSDEGAVVKDAVAHATKMTESTPKDGVAQPSTPQAEQMPKEKTLTEAEIVSQALPSLGVDASKILSAVGASSATNEKEKEEAEQEEDGKGKKKHELTVAEAKALRSLVKESAVDREKAQLAKLKAELQAAAAVKAAAAASASNIPPSAKGPIAFVTPTGATAAASTTTEGGATTQAKAPSEATASAASGGTTSTTSSSSAGTAGAAAPTATAQTSPREVEKADEVEEKPSKLDKSIEKMRLKVASMLDNLEVDLEKVEATIGDKLHILDKDKDGVLTTSELSEVIFHVLKRHNSEEEAMKVAKAMDKDADGIITVQELMEWIEHKEELLEELGDNEDKDEEKESDKKSSSSSSSSSSAEKGGSGSKTTSS